MMTSAQKYTEEQYLFYEELQDRFLKVQLDVIWKEIQTYRSLFLLPIDTDEYLTYHLRMQKDHARIQQKLQRLIREQKNELIKPRQVDEKLYMCLKNRYQTYLSYPLSILLQEFMITEMSQEFAMHYESLPLFVKMYVIQKMGTGKVKQVLITQLLFEWQIQWDQFETISITSYEKDATRSFQLWLQQIEISIENQFSQLQQKEEANYLKELRLMELYPSIKAYQAEFFEQHRKPGHYYTVEQFLHYCNTCYETARMSMEQFVRLGWYQKEKCGKKYVYYVK